MLVRRWLLASITVCLVNCGRDEVNVASDTSAILDGVEDSSSFPQVCTITWSDPNDLSAPRFSSCTGSLLTPTVMLTAGHCSFLPEFGVAVDPKVSCDAVFVPGVSAEYTGRLIRIPSMDPANNVWDPDVGVFLLDDPIQMPRYASLPREGFDTAVFDHTNAGHRPKLTVVGYGLTANPEEPMGTRRVAATSFTGLDDFFIHTAPAANMGDSGAPVFLASTRTVVAIVIGNWDGADMYGRMDRPDVLAFLRQYVP